MNKLDLDYQRLLVDILENGVTKSDRTGTGTISVFGRQIRHNMKDGFPLLTTKKMAWKTMATELIWFLKGDTNIKYLLDNDCHIWTGDAYKNYCEARPLDRDAYTVEEFEEQIKTNSDFALRYGDLGPIYGKQWRQWGEGGESSWTDINDKVLHKHKTVYLEVDQIANLINDLKTNPDSRRMMVSAWNVGDLQDMVLPPCHYGFQVYTRELTIKERVALVNPIPNLFAHEDCDAINLPKRAISLMWNQRSVDTFLGLPFNIASYALLLEIIAKAVNMVPDQLIGNLGDVHLYSNHIEQAKEQISREPFALPKLNINTEFWPYEGGECGVGPIDAVKVFESFKDDNFCKCLLEEDIQLSNYQSHPSIKAPLSN